MFILINNRWEGIMLLIVGLYGATILAIRFTFAVFHFFEFYVYNKVKRLCIKSDK